MIKNNSKQIKCKKKKEVIMTSWKEKTLEGQYHIKK
jgi:hypothetical protein